MAEKYIVVLTTMEKEEEAKELARKIISANLGACVQIFPIKSIYKWKGKIEESGEFICLIKTMKRVYPKLEKLIIENHPYETPEIIALPIEAGSKKYLGWITDSLEK